MNTRRSILLKSSVLASALLAGLAKAQKRLVRMIVPITPGTTPDLIARSIGPIMQSKLDASYVVENKPGASGMIGMDFVAKSSDPGTLLVVPATTVTLPLFYKNIDFDVINGFTPITQVVSSAFVLAVHQSVPVKNLQEFIAWARAGKGLFYASPGNGTHHHLCMELLKQTVNIQLEHAPYKGAAPAINDLLGGQIPTMFLPIQTGVAQHRAGRVRIIGSSLKDGHPGFPEIASLHEQGAKDFNVDPWFAIWGIPKLPANLVEQYRQAIVAALDDPAVRESLTKQGLIIKTGTPTDLLAMAKAESAMWTRMVRNSNIKPE
ncbi:MAG: Bug family tripartite tricarboxylate transporter substrate binding protein [Hylemonella sp.]